MPITVFVSCDSKRQFFSDCIKNICSELKDDFECHYIPNEVAPSNEPNRLDRMLSLIRESDIVFMDITPAKMRRNKVDEYITNSGVLIEYGVLAASEPYRMKLKVFCEDTVSRNQLHPYFLQTVNQYSLKMIDDEDSHVSLKSQVRQMLKEYKRRLPEIARKQAQEIEAFKALTKIR